MAEESISRYISRYAAEHPDKPAVSCGPRTLTWRELDLGTNRLARDYAKLGVKPGSMLSFVMPNGIAFVENTIAAWKLGATPQPLSYRLAPLERQALLDLVDPAIVVGLDENDRGGRPGVPAGYQAQSTDDGPLPDAVSPAWMALGTGGSTGRPKIVVSDVPGVIGGAGDVTLIGKAYGQGERTVLVVPGPLYHAGPFGLSMPGLLCGSHVVLLERFDPEATLAAVERHRATYLFVVPTMMVRIWKLGEAVRGRYDLSSLERVSHAAAPCAPWVKEAWIEWLGPKRIHESFGSSDGAGLTAIWGDEWLARRGSVGRPIIGEVAIFDDRFNRVPPGTVGEIFMRPPSQASMKRRYIGAEPPKAHEGGWWSVGDMGHLDADGFLYIADRRVDLIISGAVNIYPAEVEAALEEHPAVVCAVVVGVPDDDLGKKVHAVVQARAPVDESELRAFLAERISRIKIPKSFELTQETLRDDAGKVRRIALAERAAARLGLLAATAGGRP